MRQRLTSLGRRGFTLVELMVALIIAAIVMGGVYMLYENSTAAFRVQNQLSDLFQNVRFGAEHLRRDLERTGFLATANSDRDTAVCLNGADLPLYGVIIRREAEDFPTQDSVWEPAFNRNVLPTSITLFGDFWSRGAFRVSRVSRAQSRIFLDPNFYYDDNGDGSDDAADVPPSVVLEAWFRVGRLVRLVNREGLEMYLEVAAFTPGAGAVEPFITVVEAIPLANDGNGGCGIEGEGTGAQVNPVGYVRYRISQDTRVDAPEDKFDMVREELDPDDRTTIVPQSQLAIAEYAVDLQFYDFVFDEGLQDSPSLNVISGATGSFPNVEFVVALGGGGRLGGRPDTDLERLRALTFKLSVRTPEEDPYVTFLPRTNRWARLTSFDVNPTLMGAARVRSVASRLVLENYLMRNILP